MKGTYIHSRRSIIEQIVNCAIDKGYVVTYTKTKNLYKCTVGV